MYGSSFRERHKEWAKESIALMLKTTPWIIIFCAIIYAIFFGIQSAGRIINDISNIAGTIYGLAMIVLTVAGIMVCGPLVLGSMIIIHKIDQGYKSDPITLAYFILHDKNMWRHSFSEDFKEYIKPYGLYALLIISGLTIGSLLAPDIPPVEKTAEILAAERFWKENVGLLHLNQILNLIVMATLPYLMIHVLTKRASFNTFMLANSYKNVEECKIEGLSSRKKLLKYTLMYLYLPQVFIFLLSFAQIQMYPLALMITNAVQAIISIWIVHMDYIIGRDYYIGPPQKKQKQESYDKNLQTA